MASSNTIKDQVLLLFPDNNNKEISAADMRVFVNAIFDTKEEIVTKIPLASDIGVYKSQIFEKSIVIVESDSNGRNGVYLSNVNNPISINQCTKVAELDGTSSGSGNGNPYSTGTVEYFMYDFNYKSDLSDKDYVYNLNGNISGINIINSTDGTAIIYTVLLTYDINNDIYLKTITDTAGNKVEITFTYSNGNITNKDMVYIAV